MCTGGCRTVLADAARYAAQRRQFGQPIAQFGAIRHKLGEMTARTYAVESLVYRTAGLLDAAIEASSRDGASLAAAFEEYAIESSIAKVACSETLDFVIDENVQIHGGNGFVKDYAAERYYRDARVNRIFEGTNEINRLLIPGMLVRRGLKGALPLVAAAKRLQDEILSPLAVTIGAGRRAAGGTASGGGVQEGRAGRHRYGDADVWREADRRAGDPELCRRHPDRPLLRRERGSESTGGRRLATIPTPSSTSPPHGLSSTTRHSASRPPLGMPWRQWPTAIRFVLYWRHSGAS